MAISEHKEWNRLQHFPAERQQSGERPRPRQETLQDTSCLGVRKTAARAVGAMAHLEDQTRSRVKWDMPHRTKLGRAWGEFRSKVDSLPHGGTLFLASSYPSST